jgi:hypothetical protein
MQNPCQVAENGAYLVLPAKTQGKGVSQTQKSRFPEGEAAENGFRVSPERLRSVLDALAAQDGQATQGKQDAEGGDGAGLGDSRRSGIDAEIEGIGEAFASANGGDLACAGAGEGQNRGARVGEREAIRGADRREGFGAGEAQDGGVESRRMARFHGSTDHGSRAGVESAGGEVEIRRRHAGQREAGGAGGCEREASGAGRRKAAAGKSRSDTGSCHKGEASECGSDFVHNMFPCVWYITGLKPVCSPATRTVYEEGRNRLPISGHCCRDC